MEACPVIAIYQPKPGCEAALEELLARHHAVLSSQGLSSGKRPTYLKTPAGCILEIMEWRDEKAADRAHQNPAVQEIWTEASKLAEFKTLGDLDVASAPFPGFRNLKLPKAPGADRSFSDTMIAAKNYESTIGFYERFVGLILTEKTEEFALLTDPGTGQFLCITNGPSVEDIGTGIVTEDLDAALKDLEALGGKVVDTWEFPRMKGANATDPEGHEILIYQMKN